MEGLRKDFWAWCDPVQRAYLRELAQSSIGNMAVFDEFYKEHGAKVEKAYSILIKAVFRPRKPPTEEELNFARVWAMRAADAFFAATKGVIFIPELPHASAAFVDFRDKYLARSVQEQLRQRKLTVAVVGLGHLRGIVRLLVEGEAAWQEKSPRFQAIEELRRRRDERDARDPVGAYIARRPLLAVLPQRVAAPIARWRIGHLGKPVVMRSATAEVRRSIGLGLGVAAVLLSVREAWRRARGSKEGEK